MAMKEALSREIRANVLGRFLFIVFLLVFPALGLLVAQIGFCDPDTCWHLAIGKWISAHCQLPYVDPFSSNVGSFVFVKEGLPLMQQEWLSDVAFYFLFAYLAYAGLLLVTGLICALSFVVIPALLMARHQVPRSLAIAFIVLTIMASAFRLWVRPEVFSFLLMAALILINEICQNSTRNKFGACCLAVFVIMALWTNFHAVFVIGIAYLVGYIGAALLEFLIFRESSINLSRTVALLIAGLLGTLCTPWQFEYWRYIFKLTTSPILRMNKENGPMTFADLANPTFYPLLIVLVLYWTIILARIFKQRQALKGQCFSVIVGLAVSVAVFLVRRMAPFLLLTLVVAIARSFRGQKQKSPDDLADKPVAGIEEYLKKCGVPSGLQSNLIGLVLCALTSLVSTSFLVPARLPSPSRLFHPPWQALTYIESHCPSGRMLNDTKFGSMMSWCMDRPPDIFVDGRFDSACDRKLIREYMQMRLCQGDWRKLIDQYKIGWVFFEPETPIISELSKEGWKKDFADKTAVILERENQTLVGPALVAPGHK
jgi:hypothetical protein